jgi:hypothetical protein
MSVLLLRHAVATAVAAAAAAAAAALEHGNHLLSLDLFAVRG